MKTLEARLTEVINRAGPVKTFRFMPEEKIDFVPGQFLQLIFDSDDPNDRRMNKYLSFSSSPGKEYVEVTKKISDSDFSRSLIALRPGDKVLLKAPMGNCVLRDEYKNIGFLAGGIGITPVISMLEYIEENGGERDVCLFYSNRREEDIAFRKELQSWQSDKIRVCYFITDCQPNDRKCRSGRIGKDDVDNDDWRRRVIFIFGPPVFVSAMEGLCKDAGCRTENIKKESFIGY